MKVNRHYAYAESAFASINAQAAPEFNEALRADALIQATLALAWETARCADEARTANIIASMNPVEMNDGSVAKIRVEPAQRRLNEIKDRLDSEGATS